MARLSIEGIREQFQLRPDLSGYELLAIDTTELAPADSAAQILEHLDA